MKKTLCLLSIGFNTLHAVSSSTQTNIYGVMPQIYKIRKHITSINTKALSSKTQTVHYINNDNYQLRLIRHIIDDTQRKIYSKLDTRKKVLEQFFKMCNCVLISRNQIQKLLNDMLSAEKFSKATHAINQKVQCTESMIQNTLRNLIKATLADPNLHTPTYAQYKQILQPNILPDDALLKQVYNDCLLHIRTQIKKLFLQKDMANSQQARAIVARLLNEILCNPVGCELLRLIATKTYLNSDKSISNTPSLAIVIYEGWNMDAHFARECINSSSISLPPSIHLPLTNFPKRYSASNLFANTLNKLFISSEAYPEGQVLFHELLHFLHTLELKKNGTLNNMDFQIKALIQARNPTTNNANEYTYKAMKNDEELYTITGLQLRVYTKKNTSIAYFFYDPISEYSFLKAAGKTTRIFHQTPLQDNQYWEVSNSPFITLGDISTLINYQIQNDVLAKRQINLFAQKYKKWITAAQKARMNATSDNWQSNYDDTVYNNNNNDMDYGDFYV